MKDLRESLDRSLSGVEFRPELRRRVREAVRPEAGKGAMMRRKMSAALMLALIAVLILAAVAVAAVITRGFGWFATQYDGADAYNLSELGRRAEDIVARQSVSKENGSGEAFRFEVLQGYYDGSRADVAYNMEIVDRSADTSWRPTADDVSKMIRYGDSASSSFVNGFEALNGEFRRSHEEGTAIGVHIHDYLLSDGAYLTDGTRLEWENGNETWKGNVMTGYRGFDSLPEEARNRDSVRIIFQVREYDGYYYQDETGSRYYMGQEGRTVELAPVALIRGEGGTKAVQGTKDFGTYTIWAMASVSPVGVQATVWQKLPEAWITADVWKRDGDLAKTDYVNDYLLLADGARLEGHLISEGYASAMAAVKSIGEEGVRRSIPDVFRKEALEKLYRIRLEYQGVPEGAKELRLRPVYSISGEHPDEDLVLTIPDQP